MTQLLVLDQISESEPIKVYVNSPGGLADDGFRLWDAGDPGQTLRSPALEHPQDGVVRLLLDTAVDAWWRDRDLRLEVGPPLADLRGNPMIRTFEALFTAGGEGLTGGFLSGEIYDDTTGGVPPLVDWVNAMIDDDPSWVNVEADPFNVLFPGDPRPDPLEAPFVLDGPGPDADVVVDCP